MGLSWGGKFVLLLLGFFFFKAIKVLYSREPGENSVESKAEKTPGLILTSLTRIKSELSLCMKSLSAHREQKVT